MNERERMIRALKDILVPYLRELGFSGSFPHFRRYNEGDRVDLLSVAFEKWGGAFYIEASYVLAGEKWTNVGYPAIRSKEDVKNINVWNTQLRYRIRSGRKETWFYYCDLYEETVKAPGEKTIKMLSSVTQGKKSEMVTDSMKLIKNVDEKIYESVATLAKEKMNQAIHWWKKHPTLWEKYRHTKKHKKLSTDNKLSGE